MPSASISKKRVTSLTNQNLITSPPPLASRPVSRTQGHDSKPCNHQRKLDPKVLVLTEFSPSGCPIEEGDREESPCGQRVKKRLKGLRGCSRQKDRESVAQDNPKGRHERKKHIKGKKRLRSMALRSMLTPRANAAVPLWARTAIRITKAWTILFSVPKAMPVMMECMERISIRI